MMVDDFQEKEAKKMSLTNGNIIDFSNFISNNWLRTKLNNTLKELDKLGVAIWVNVGGDLCYRLSDEGKVATNLQQNKSNKVFTNLLNRDIKFFTGTKEKKADILITELYLIHKESFEPFIMSEFYKDGLAFARNTFKPSKYLRLNAGTHKEPSTILSLISHLANDDEYRANYIINWLAYFFQGLKKSQVALVLRGNQGAGKGILFNDIIKPLFSTEYCIQVNDKTLETNFIGGILDKKLFFNLDEISHNVAGSKNIKNTLKAIVTNESITVEKKNINTEEELKLYGQVLITSNEPYVLEVEPNDRRYTIFTTGNNLSKVDYLGHKNYDIFIENIRKELKDFALFLKSFSVDKKLANTAEENEEKKALINSTSDRFKLFVNAIENKDIDYFNELEEESHLLFYPLIEDFKLDRICKENLTLYFNNLHNEKVGSRALFKRIKLISPSLFSDENIQKSNGKRYYKINLKPLEQIPINRDTALL